MDCSSRFGYSLNDFHVFGITFFEHGFCIYCWCCCFCCCYCFGGGTWLVITSCHSIVIQRVFARRMAICVLLLLLLLVLGTGEKPGITSMAGSSWPGRRRAPLFASILYRIYPIANKKNPKQRATRLKHSKH